MSELLFEIGTEEIPAGYIRPALDQLAGELKKKLNDLGLGYENLRTYGTPRRLALTLDGVQAKQEDRRQEHIGPSKKAGVDAQGHFTKAALGFARSKGVEPEAIKIVDTAKGPYLMVVEDIQGQETKVLLPALLESVLKSVVFPKSMHWADYSMVFARPIQWLLALYDGAVVPMEIEGVSCSNTSLGHRFMAPQTFTVDSIASYRQSLEDHCVIADIEKRKERVVAEVQGAVKARTDYVDAAPVLHEGLLETVTNLVEYPYGVCGSFDEKFLQVPEEALVTSMREHQKYFPVADKEGRLLPLFVAVNNTNVKDKVLAASGHEKVLRARLEDGLFFFNEDKKTPLFDLCEALDGIVFQNKLGTMRAKSERITALAGYLAEQIAPSSKEEVCRAAQLAKADLLTSMVGEFPSLQGVMGRVYALHSGEKEAVAQAIEEHYMPLRAGEAVPSHIEGALVGIADRMDTLVGCFAIGEKPTGNKDAFGLRRQAIGLLSILRECKLSLSLQELAREALQGYRGVVEPKLDVVNEVVSFIRLRFENDQIAAGFPQALVEAATSVGFDDVLDCLLRIDALQHIRGAESFAVLAGSFKRIRNIIKENKDTTIDQELLVEPAEKELAAALAKVTAQAVPLIANKSYQQALQALLEIKEPVDQFFDQVMVMAEEEKLRTNRLNLLTALGDLVLKVGDISKMHVE